MRVANDLSPETTRHHHLPPPFTSALSALLLGFAGWMNCVGCQRNTLAGASPDSSPRAQASGEPKRTSAFNCQRLIRIVPTQCRVQRPSARSLPHDTVLATATVEMFNCYVMEILVVTLYLCVHRFPLHCRGLIMITRLSRQATHNDNTRIAH